ncbi:MAG: tetratricopeptide repeat-containing sensor histidine kinase [Bacteroidota bacterium]
MMSLLNYSKRLYLLAFFLLMPPINIRAQIDGLLHDLSKSLPDTTRLDLLNQLAFQYRLVDTDSTLYYAGKAHALATQKEEKKWIGRSLGSFGVAYHIKGNFDSAVSYYQRAIPFAESSNDISGLSQVFNNLGLVDWNRGNLNKALDLFLRSYQIEEARGDSIGLIKALNNIGLVYRNMGEEEMALDYFLRTEKLLTPIGNPFRLSQLHNNLGLAYDQLGKRDSSFYHYRRSLLFAKQADARCYKAHPLLGLADLFSKVEASSADSLIFYAQKSLDLAKTCGLPKIQSGALLILGDGYLRNGFPNQAVALYSQALKLSKENDIKDHIMESHLRFYRMYKIQSNWEMALKSFESYEKVKAELLDEEKIREITLLEAQYEAAKERQLLMAKQDSERLLFENELQRERVKLTFYAAFAITLFVLILILFRSYKKEKAASKTLAQKNLLIEELSIYKNDLTHMIAHDIKNPLNAIITLSKKVNNHLGKDIAKAGNTIMNLLINMLELEKSREVKPDLKLERCSLLEMLQEACTAVELLLADKSISLNNEMSEDFELKVDRQMINRVFINLLTNAIKYSPSNDQISISAKANDHRKLKIGISDHGPGVSEEEQQQIFTKYYQSHRQKSGMAPSTGLGLAFCQMAIDLHNGQIEITSKTGQGTTFWITMTYESANEISLQPQSTEEIVFSKAEKEELHPFLTQLENLKVHNVGSIMSIMEEVKSGGLQEVWSNQVRNAVRYANDKRFKELVQMLKI